MSGVTCGVPASVRIRAKIAAQERTEAEKAMHTFRLNNVPGERIREWIDAPLNPRTRRVDKQFERDVFEATGAHINSARVRAHMRQMLAH